MKPLLVLVVTFMVAYVTLRWLRGWWDYRWAARIAMSAMMLFTAVAHFKFTKGMVMMLPSFVPFKKGLVYITGVTEAAAAVGLVFDGWFALAGEMLILQLMLMLPANVEAARRRVDIERGTLDGRGMGYLWFRLPLQVFFVGWIFVLILY